MLHPPIGEGQMLAEAGGIHVLHVLPGLGGGGAEHLALQLMRAHMATHGGQHTVLTARPGGALAPAFEAAGIPVLSPAALTGGLQPWRGRHRTRRRSIDVMHGWMLGGNLLASLAHRALGASMPLIWSHHTEDLVPQGRALRHRLAAQLVRRWAAHRAAAPWSVHVSHHGAKRHTTAGLHIPAARQVIIPCGVDTATYRPNAFHRRQQRTALRIPPTAQVVALVARADGAKDHATFFAAAAIAVAQRQQAGGPPLVFVAIGAGVPKHCAPFVSALPHDVAACVRLLPAQPAMAMWYPAFDLTTLSSRSEACPLVVLEAQACGVPCVVTDVGDCRRLVPSGQHVVPPQDCTLLAAAWLRILDRYAGTHDGAQAQRFVQQHYPITRCIDAYAHLYRRCIAMHHSAAPCDSAVS